MCVRACVGGCVCLCQCVRVCVSFSVYVCVCVWGGGGVRACARVRVIRVEFRKYAHLKNV